MDDKNISGVHQALLTHARIMVQGLYDELMTLAEPDGELLARDEISVEVIDGGVRVMFVPKSGKTKSKKTKATPTPLDNSADDA